jgi:peptidoglycan/LPS O-acetylase OafA/YrhL
MQKTLIDPLTSARGFAAIYVVIYHIKARLGDFDLPAYMPSINYGWLGVDFFFILSGFILAYVYGPDFEKKRFRHFDFLLSRVARIYPVHLATLLFWILLGAWSGFLLTTQRFGIEGFVANLLMVHSWHLLPQNSWNFPAWSISAEWFAYLCFPIFMAVVARVKDHLVINLILAVALISLLQVFIEYLPGRRFNWTYDWSIVRILCEFTAGIFLWRAYRQLKSGLVWDAVAVVSIGASLYLLTVQPNLPIVRMELVVVLLTALAILAFSRVTGPVATVLGWAPLTYLGRISYSMYMWHAAPLYVISVYIRRNVEADLTFWQGAGVLALYLSLVGLGAVLIYHFIEKPGRNFVRTKGQGWFRREVDLEVEKRAAKAG